MKDLARELGVSVTTVSNAYSHPDRLSSTLREKILATGDSLGYCGPDAAGRVLRSGKANAIGVLCGSGYSQAFRDEYTRSMLLALSFELEERGVALTLLPTGLHEDNEAAVASAVVDGFISLSSRTDSAAVRLAQRRKLPVIYGHADPDLEFVAPDDHAGGVALGVMVREAGHRRVAIIHTTPVIEAPVVVASAAELAPDDTQHGWARTRALAFREGLGSDVEVVFALLPGGWAGEFDLDFLLGLDVTAAMCMSDRTAVALIAKLEARGLRVPDDLSVTGFDGTPQAMNRRLTTAVQPIAERGRRIAQLLLDPTDQDRQVVLPVEIVPGTTVGPPRT